MDGWVDVLHVGAMLWASRSVWPDFSGQETRTVGAALARTACMGCPRSAHPPALRRDKSAARSDDTTTPYFRSAVWMQSPLWRGCASERNMLFDDEELAAAVVEFVAVQILDAQFCVVSMEVQVDAGAPFA